MPTTHERLAEILSNVKIPALSLCWHQEGKRKIFASGLTDTSNPKPVDENTLFQAASLSKPVSAAIVLDLVRQAQWNLDMSLADIGVYGPADIQSDLYYRKLTIRMVIGQNSGLPNWFSGEKSKNFIAEPGKYFNYSGVAFDFLKEVIERKLQKNWETIAQEFFLKVGMKDSTFKSLPVSDMRSVARAHQADLTPYPVIASVDSQEIPAGSLLTTATDYIAFLRYCFHDSFLRSTLLKGCTALNPERFPEMPQVAEKIQWGLGMGIFTDQTKQIAFHWGNNIGSHAFCAINILTGDSVACFINSENGPNVFQKLSEAVMGDMSLIFDWLSQYCSFNAVSQPKIHVSAIELFQAVNALADSSAILKLK